LGAKKTPLHSPNLRPRSARERPGPFVSATYSAKFELCAQFARSLRVAARPIACLHWSFRASKCSLTQIKMRPALGLTPGHCSRIFSPQASRTAAIFTSAAWHGSVKSWKCASVHLARRPPSGRSGAQNSTTKRDFAFERFSLNAFYEGFATAFTAVKREFFITGSLAPRKPLTSLLSAALLTNRPCRQRVNEEG
jgi:hypothetical protein